MSEKRATSRTGIYRIIVILFAFLIRLININAPLIGQQHDFRQSQTAIVIQCFFKDGMDILGYQIPVFGAPWKVPFELPLYQSLVYICMRAFGACDITLWSRIISVLIFLASAVVLWLIVYNILDNRIADITVFIYLLAPFCVYWSRAILIDYFSVLLALLYILGIVHYVKHTKYLFLLIGCLFGTLAYLQKSTTMFSIVFFIFFFLCNYYWTLFKSSDDKSVLIWATHYFKNNRMKSIMLICGCVIPVIPTVFWNNYADSIRINGNIFTRCLATAKLSEWNYGSISQRLSISNWLRVLDHISPLFGGTIVMVALLIVYFCFSKRQNGFWLIVSWGSVFIAPLILFNLYFVHNYYSIAITPFSALCMGILVSEIYNSLIKNRLPLRMGITLFVFCSLIMINGFSDLLGCFVSETYFDCSLSLLSDISNENDLLIITGCDWNPVLLYELDRKGTMIVHWEGCDNETILSSVISDEPYRYIFGIDAIDNEFYINAFPTNIQYLNKDGVFLAELSTEAEYEHLMNEVEWIPVSLVDDSICLLCENESIIELIRTDVDDSYVQPVDVYLDGDFICETYVIFAANEETLYIDTRGITGNVQLVFPDNEVTSVYYSE